jgi:predicted ATPase
LPFIKSITTESNFDKSVSYKIQETYSNKHLYANFLSDGTVSMIAIIIALYFEDTMGTVILEEPERNLHPSLMDRVIEMAREASKDKQILITTHTPELIKHADSDSILLASRCDNGYTCIEKPIDKEAVRIFLENEIGIETLFAQNLL